MDDIVAGVVSCVIPYGGAAAYLDEAVQSAASQRFGEIIVVNDGRPHEQLSTIANLPNVRIVHLENSAGVSNARNVGIRACKTPYVALLDGDDLFSEGYLEAIVPWMAERKLRCAGAKIRYIGEDRYRVGQLVSRSDTLLPSGFLSEVSLFAEAGYFPDSNAEDTLLFRAIKKITRLTVCPAAQVLYRIHARSDSSTRGVAIWAFIQLLPLYDSGELTLAQANSIANTFATEGTTPPGMESLFSGISSARVRLLGRLAYASWLNQDFLQLARFGSALLPYLPQAARLAWRKWGTATATLCKDSPRS